MAKTKVHSHKRVLKALRANMTDEKQAKLSYRQLARSKGLPKSAKSTLRHIAKQEAHHRVELKQIERKLKKK